jgi:hypothetical protein
MALLSGRGDGKIVDAGVQPLLALVDKHHRNIISDGVLPFTVRFLAYQPAIVDQFQASRVCPGLASLTTDAVGTT